MIKKLLTQKTLLLIFLTLFTFSIKAQDLTLDWVKQIGSSDNESANSIVLDASGNSYIIGTFSNTVDFDPGTGTTNLTSNGAKDIYITKLDSNGNLIWVKQIGGTQDDNASAITLDSNGNIYITGVFTFTTDFNPNVGVYDLTAVASEDVFILKLDSNGDFIWAKQLESISNTKSYDLKVDTQGNVYTTGFFWSTTDFDPSSSTNYNLTSAGGSDIFIVKLDISGDFVWARQFGDNTDALGHSITIDSANNVYTTGYFSNTVDFDPGTNTYNLTSDSVGEFNSFNGFVSKLDTNGDFVWAKKISSDDDLYANSISIDTSGNSYISGFFEGTADFDPSAASLNKTSLGELDSFMTKLDASGNLLWAKHIAGTTNNFSFSSNIDSSGDIYITGRFDGATNFDDVNTYNLTPFGAGDIFIAKFDTSGVFQWTKQFGGTAYEGGNSITIDTAGDIYTIGGFNGTANFGVDSHTSNLNSLGASDIFIQKLTYCAIDNSVSTTGNTLTANSTIGSFQWIDCDTNTDITGENNQSFTPTAIGNYSVRVTNDNCAATSDCQEVSSLSVGELDIDNKMSIYPNPNNGIVNIQLTNASKASVKVFTVFGQLVYNNPNIDSIHQFRLNEASGIYIIEVEQQNKKQHFKLIKE